MRKTKSCLYTKKKKPREEWQKVIEIMTKMRFTRKKIISKNSWEKKEKDNMGKSYSYSSIKLEQNGKIITWKGILVGIFNGFSVF